MQCCYFFGCPRHTHHSRESHAEALRSVERGHEATVAEHNSRDQAAKKVIGDVQARLLASQSEKETLETTLHDVRLNHDAATKKNSLMQNELEAKSAQVVDLKTKLEQLTKLGRSLQAKITQSRASILLSDHFH